MKRLSERPTFLYYGLGGTIGIVLIYIFKPSFLSPGIIDNPERLLEILLVWWLVSFVGGLALGQIKIQRVERNKNV